MQKIDVQEIMTQEEAQERYSKNWLLFVYTEENQRVPHESKGYVAYIFDSESEMYKNMPEGYIGKMPCGMLFGLDAISDDEIGRVVYS